jgi:hypothetical protein
MLSSDEHAKNAIHIRLIPEIRQAAASIYLRRNILHGLRFSEPES